MTDQSTVSNHPDGTRRPARRTKGATEADLRAAFQYRDDHNIGDTDGTYDQCHHSEPEKEAIERPRRGGPGSEHIGRLAHGRLVRRLGVGGLREQRLNCCLMTGGGAHVDGARRACLCLAADYADIAEILLGGRITD